MRFVVLGTSQFTLSCAQALLDSGGEICALVSLPQHALPDNSVDVATFAEANEVPYYEMENINSPENVSLLQGCAVDYILSSWPKIVKKEILESPRFFCIGTHPTELPFNRGRHPLQWLIVMGILETELSFFRIDEGIDSGNILIQIPFGITSDGSIRDFVKRMNETAYEGTKTLYRKLLEDPYYGGIKQDNSLANYWRKRTPHDVTLDMRMSSSIILRIVQSFAPPYPCANLIYENHIIKISHASIARVKLSPECLQRIEPGRIIHIEENIIRVKADDAIIDLESKGKIPGTLVKASYIHPPSKYIVEWPGDLIAKLS